MELDMGTKPAMDFFLNLLGNFFSDFPYIINQVRKNKNAPAAINRRKYDSRYK